MKKRQKRFSASFVFRSLFVFLMLLFVIASFFGIRYINKQRGIPSLKEISQDWKMSSYNSVYLKAEQILKNDPFNAEALTFKGFSSYYIYVTENDESNNLAYLEKSIISLRQAMYFLKETEKPKVAYILGKAYYQKGEYYADLAIEYLNIAEAAGMSFSDLKEFKGMACLSLGRLEEATEAFTEALKDEASPFLLYILGETYLKMEDLQNAKQYFFETITKTKDELLQLKCRCYIANILLDEGELDRAKLEFLAILEKDDSSSDAHYGLGVILEKEGDLVKARSEWRRALKNNPSHEKTKEKLKV